MPTFNSAEATIGSSYFANGTWLNNRFNVVLANVRR